MLECVQNIVNTDVFDRFRFFDFFVNFEFPGFDFRCFLGAFWVLFGVLGTHLDDLRESFETRWSLAGQAGWPGGSQSEDTWQLEGRLMHSGGRKQPIQ